MGNCLIRRKAVGAKVVGSLYSLGTGTSFNIKTLYPSYYSSLTADNFFASAMPTGSSAWSSTFNWQPTVSVSMTKSYNSSTGVLTFYPTASGDHTSTGTCTVFMYIADKNDGTKVTQITALGTGKSFTITSAIYKDYTKLTAANFYFSTSASYSFKNNFRERVWDYMYAGTSQSLVKTYTASTGVLSFYMSNPYNSGSWGSSGTSSSNVTAWLIVTK